LILALFLTRRTRIRETRRKTGKQLEEEKGKENRVVRKRKRSSREGEQAAPTRLIE
jgi:hypothetical protein